MFLLLTVLPLVGYCWLASASPGWLLEPPLLDSSQTQGDHRVIFHPFSWWAWFPSPLRPCFNVFQGKVVAQWVGPRDVLQDLRPRALRHHPLSQPVSKFHPCWGRSGTASPNTGHSPDAGRENKPKKGGICVANHTSPIDILILCNDGGYAMVQMQPFIENTPH